MNQVAIVAARRTPVGRMTGRFASVTPIEMALAVGGSLFDRISASVIEQVIIGQVYSAGHGMNLARQIGVRLGIPLESPAYTVNMMCGSGMHAAALGAAAIRAGEVRTALVGGVESMSLAPIAIPRPAKGASLDMSLAVDTLQRDGLIDSFHDVHMGVTAESLARDYKISRREQDEFARRSQVLYNEALQAGRFRDECVMLAGVDHDEPPRPEVSLESLTNLSPVFDPAGTITAGNASGLSHGAALLVLAEKQFAISQGWPILAHWKDSVTVGCDPLRMGLGPVYAIRELFRRQSTCWANIDSLEINEAFAAQVLSCLKEMRLELDLCDPRQTRLHAGESKVRFNANGGAIAIGHPLAASGARLLVHMALSISRGESRQAVGSLCIGGGMGIATLLSSSEK